jgi:hypothetical protein
MTARQLAVKVKIDLPAEDLRRLQRLVRAVGADAPEVREAFEGAVDGVLIPMLRAAAPGSMGRKISRTKIGQAKGGSAPRTTVKIRHPGAAPYEFGRKKYWRGWKGRARGRGAYERLGGRPFRSAIGQRPRPWIGVKGGGVLAAAKGPMASSIEAAVERALKRLGAD